MLEFFHFNRSFTLFILTLSGIIGLFILGCKKPEVSSPIQETSTVTDFDGNSYKTVKIGNQWWMAENLKVKHYRNGIIIPATVNNNDTLIWNEKGAFCVYDNNTGAPGLLYNWAAVNDSARLAPLGWHIPSDAEWKELEIHLGMSQSVADDVNWRGTTEGDKLKIDGSGYWYPYTNIWGSNESGFSGMAGGARMFNGGWSNPYGLQFTGFWWSSSEGAQNEAWYRYLDYKNSGIFRYHGPKTYGFSLRCVKD